jgi:hypothetical protein
MRSVSVGLCARILALVASPTLLLLLLVAPVAASGPFGTINVDSQATLDLHSGDLTVSGSVDCAAAGSIELNIGASQQIGQANVTGFGFGSVVCAGADTTVTWQATILPDFSKFNPGTIDLFIDGEHCLPAPDGCVPDPIDVQVNARPLGKVPPPPAPPSNDEATGAIALTLDGGAYAEDTSAATSGAADPVCPEIQPFAGHTVWFTITAGTDTEAIELSTAGSNFDTTLAVLDGTGAVIACNDDVEAGTLRTSDLIFAPTPEATYTVVAGSWETTSGGTLILDATSTVVPPPPPPPPPAPVNDDPTGALPLVLGTPSDPLDTTGATVGPEDPADGVCDLPLNATTVWYTLEIAPADVGWVQVDTLASDYDTTLYVYDAAGTLLACNDQAHLSNQSLLVFFADPGTYTVLVGSWNSGPGGTLILSATPTVPPLTVGVTIDSIGSVDTKTGDATVAGTITCSEEASGTIGVDLSQGGGRFLASSSAEVEVASCGPTPTAWSALVERGTAKFQVGAAFAAADAFMATELTEAEAFAEADIQLKPAGSKH